jgi:hypothetical protein
MVDKSFTITLANNRLEKDGIEFMKQRRTGYFSVDNKERKHILDLLGQPHSFSRAFDMIYIPRYEGAFVTEETIDTHIDEITLIELKVTRKFLPESPKGFFFGATENEFEFGRRLTDKFSFCFVCLNPLSESAILLTVADLERIIRTRRIQYQINL